eukprot:10451658-Ditylum_brightwellii.AAC.2
MDDDRAYIALAIKNNNAITISDGSCKNSTGSAACVIEGLKHRYHRVASTATNPGPLLIHDSYQAELTGLYMIVSITNNICAFHRVSSGSMTVAYDGLEAIKKAMAEETHCSCQSNHWASLNVEIDTAAKAR